MTQGLELRGAVLGKGYRLGRRLDPPDSAHDVVHEATHERIPGRFIIRLFPPESLSQAESSSRIQRGARVASLLRDPHAVQVLDCNISGEVPAFVVFERVPGRSLAEILAEEGMLPLGPVVNLVDSLAAALTAGHQIGLVHGDLRPAHVIIPTSGQPAAKLAGFGWAKELRAAARVPSPSGYLAPEQDFGKVLTLDERADQFGLAALTYEMIAACLPFSAESADLADVLGVRRRTPPAIAELVPGIPSAVDGVLRTGLAFAPSERFSTVMEFAAQLREAAVGKPARDGQLAGAMPRDDANLGVSPAKPRNDVTEELDIAALLPPEGDESEGEVSEGEQREDDSQDANLVLGGPSGSQGTVADDARTQIVRSPFFEGPESDDDSSSDSAVPVLTPLKGIPVGRPPVGALAGGNRPGAFSPKGGAALVTSPGMGSRFLSHREGPRPGSWPDLLRHKWTIPAVTGVGLLLLVGAMIWIARGGNDEEPARVATMPTVRRQIAEPAVTGLPPASPLASVPAEPPAATDQSHAAAAANESGLPVTRTPLVPTTPHSKRPPPTDRGGPIVAPEGFPQRVQADRPLIRRPSQTKTPESAGAKATPSIKQASTIGANECSIRISSKPWAEVWIDGKNTGRKTPIDNLKVTCGSRKLELKRPDKDIEQMEMLNVVPGKLYRGNYELE